MEDRTIIGWKYYNRAAVPTTPPHLLPNFRPLLDKSIWSMTGNPMLARWVTDWDIEDSNWWYMIKDSPFSLSTLKSKRRYEITKGLKHFNVVRINPVEYREQIFDVLSKAYTAWPVKYRPKVDFDSVCRYVIDWNEKYSVYGAFEKGTNLLCGFAYLTEDSSFIDFNVMRTIPEYEKYGLNAAIVYKLITDYDSAIKSGKYICDGSRSISHETAFQDYLEKYFEFRKVYCKLQISYNPKVKWFINIAFFFRKQLCIFDSIQLIHNINGILKMEEIARNG